MKQYMFPLSFLVLPLLLSHPALATESLSLKQAVEEAKIHSPFYLRALAASQEASWRQLEALSVNLPHISASANHFFDAQFQQLTITTLSAAPVKFPAIYPLTLASVDASWTIFDGLQTPFNYSAARLSKQAADLDLAHTAFMLEGDVTLKFCQALGAQLLALVAEQNLKTLEDHLAKTRELLAQGKVTRFDLLRVQVQLDEAEPDKLQADDNVTIARHTLTQAMGLENDDRALTGSLPVPTAPKELGQIQFELKSRDDIQALLDRAEAADRAHTASLGTFLPRATVAVSQQYYNNIDKSLTPSTFAGAYSLGFFLTWNLFDGGASLARQFETVHQREQAEATARAAVLAAPNDVRIWSRKLLYNVSLYKARSHAIDSAEESVRLARLSYTAGTRTNTDVLDAELDLFRARAGVVQAQLDSIQARLNLDLALGTKL